MSNPLPLQYKIADWHHLSKCKSNNSSKFNISVSDIADDELLNCLLIKVFHPKYGVVFACTLHAGGDIVSNSKYTDNISFELTPEYILQELHKWGFNIIYEPSKSLSGPTLDMLLKLQDLGYDKIRILSVWRYEHGVKQYNSKVVCFKVTANSNWIDLQYSPSDREYLCALGNGTAINISSISYDKQLDWSWLSGMVGDIKDILRENAEVFNS